MLVEIVQKYGSDKIITPHVVNQDIEGSYVHILYVWVEPINIKLMVHELDHKVGILFYEFLERE
jgi:hypothetical protein